MIRPTSWIAATRSTTHLAGLHVDRDLRDLDPEGEDAHPGRIRAARSLAEDLPVVEQARDLAERPGAAVGRDDPAVLQRQDALLEVEALGGDLQDLPRRVGRRRAHGRAHARHRRRSGRDGRVRPARGVPERDPDVVERQPQLLGGDLRHRGPGAGADVLHRRDHRRAPVRADAHPGVGRRAAAAVPDLAREADAALPRALGPAPGPRPGAPSAAPRAGSTRAGSCPRTAARPPDRLPAWFLLRSSSGSRSRRAASSSRRHSRPNVPSTYPGARKAAFGGVFRRAPQDTVRTFSHA